MLLRLWPIAVVMFLSIRHFIEPSALESRNWAHRQGRNNYYQTWWLMVTIWNQNHIVVCIKWLTVSQGLFNVSMFQIFKYTTSMIVSNNLAWASLKMFHRGELFDDIHFSKLLSSYNCRYFQEHYWSVCSDVEYKELYRCCAGRR